ncbi:hypothetical protein [Algoriphagus hitonicola]|uniref:Uncharacterized protein n=1 Tax=Algoriphagus hitonicola TaxID=435880 RepID=A0A1I2UNC6_9BACT|nr:hypothetical protein [Algoriphagus hitonicola]SFG78553.1 hypothetical protein SAMN04487988_10840 [Algoriphagus hitonicola]
MKTIVASLLTLLLLFQISVGMACSGVYYGCTESERQAIKDDADQNCCQGDTVWIDNCEPDTIPEPYEVALNGTNADCPSFGD